MPVSFTVPLVALLRLHLRQLAMFAIANWIKTRFHLTKQCFNLMQFQEAMPQQGVRP